MLKPTVFALITTAVVLVGSSDAAAQCLTFSPAVPCQPLKPFVTQTPKPAPVPVQPQAIDCKMILPVNPNVRSAMPVITPDSNVRYAMRVIPAPSCTIAAVPRDTDDARRR